MCKVDASPPEDGGKATETKYGSLPTALSVDSGGDEFYSDKRTSKRRDMCKLIAVLGGLGVVFAGPGLAKWGLETRHESGTASDHTDNGGSKSSSSGTIPPLSTTSPADLGLKGVVRNEWNVPGKVWGSRMLGTSGGESESGRRYTSKASLPNKPLPTNSWYQNLLTQNAGAGSNENNQVYTVPYILDTVGPVTGLRMHWPLLRAGRTNMQMVFDAVNGLTVGTDDEGVGRQYYIDDEVESMSPLGLSLKWGNEEGARSMTTYITRGMPYSTLRYSGGISPSIHSGNTLASSLVDDTTELTCGTIEDGGSYSKDSETVDVEGEIQLHFDNSDITWIVFVSRPVKVKCAVAGEMPPGMILETMFQMRIEESDDGNAEEPLYVRTALLNQCTTGHSNIHAHCKQENRFTDTEGYLAALRKGAGVFAKDPKLEIDYGKDSKGDGDVANIMFDWDAHTVDGGVVSSADLLAFALPHHQTSLHPLSNSSSTVSHNTVTDHCAHTFHGRTCLVLGSKWSMSEPLGPPPSFNAGRAPEASAVPELAKALKRDIKVRPSDNLSRGAADTYFSGKVLARIGRVVAIADELRELAEGSIGTEPAEVVSVRNELRKSAHAAQSVSIPTERDISASVSALKEAVQVWINGTGEAPYVFDESWGGLVNCGCDYEGEGEHGTCGNEFPDCPALDDVNLDFGNGYYMDHHFHYGYHIYAAAVVAKHDPDWGRKYFDRILLYIRDIANPSLEDAAFPLFRHKDWYLGSSWASGLMSAGIPTPSHGRNQESSSEAIAAYEAIALFGDVMAKVFGHDANSAEDLESARLVRDVGRLLTSTEISAAKRYWHVYNTTSHVNTYPPEYKEAVVGMLHETMASFQTWFGPQEFMSYGIQLMPFTSVGEVRDDPEWASILFPAYNRSCYANEDICVDNGWSIVLSGLRATVGQRKEALEDALSVPEKVFKSDGACGHSLSNTIWYIATRPPVGTRNK